MSFPIIIFTKALLAQDISVSSSSKLIKDSCYRNKDFLQAAINYEKYLFSENREISEVDFILLANSYYKAGNEEKAIWALKFLVKAFIFSECQEIQLNFKQTTLEKNSRYVQILKKCDCNRKGKSRAFKPDVAGILEVFI